MYARCIAALTALATAVTLTSVAAAGPEASKQRVAVNLRIFPQQKFVFTPLQPGPLEADSGAITSISKVMAVRGRNLLRDGQQVTIYSPATWTLEGKRGTLTIRERNEWVDVGHDVNRDGQPDGIAFGTWSFVRGTGQYAGLAGAGRSGHVGLGRVWYSRAEGLLRSN